MFEETKRSAADVAENVQPELYEEKNE